MLVSPPLPRHPVGPFLGKVRWLFVQSSAWRLLPVTRSDLRTLFRSNDRNLKAVDGFADRENVVAAVTRGLATRIEANRSPSFDVEDL